MDIKNRRRNLFAYLFAAEGRSFEVVADSFNEAITHAREAASAAQYCGMSQSLPGVTSHVLAEAR